jgi:hypothetical protein
LEAATTRALNSMIEFLVTSAERKSKKQSAASRRASYVEDLVHESIVCELDKSGFIKQGLESMKGVKRKLTSSSLELNS